MKIDLKKELKYLYSPSAKQVEIIDVPEFNFLMLDGRIEPRETPGTSPDFQDAVGALSSVSYTLKFASKLRKVDPIDYGVMALEGLWWVESGEFDFTNDTQEWNWTLMIMQPAHITREMFQETLSKLRAKEDAAAFTKLRLETFGEGLCIQTLHVGPYSEEKRTIERMRSFAQVNDLVPNGKHHEIYLGDPRRAQPEKLRTILRQPARKLA